MSASFADALTEDRRLVILRLLNDQQAANDSALHAALTAIGHQIPRDTVREDMWWLHERALVHVEIVGQVYLVATITERGQNVAFGRVVVPGIKRPTPRR